MSKHLSSNVLAQKHEATTKTAGIRPRRGLFVECCPYHEELIPAWLRMAGDLGVGLDLAVVDGRSQRQVVASLDRTDLRVFRADHLDDVPMADYDFVLLGSLVHAGYGLDLPLLAGAHGFDRRVPRPDLELLRRLDRPSLSVCHEPRSWVDQVPNACFDLAEDGAASQRGLVRLYPNGSWFADCVDGRAGDGTGFQRWGSYRFDAAEPARIQLFEGGSTAGLATTDGGQSYRSDDGSTVWRRQAYVEPDLAGHLRSGRHAVAALSKPGRDYLRTRGTALRSRPPSASAEPARPAGPWRAAPAAPRFRRGLDRRPRGPRGARRHSWEITIRWSTATSPCVVVVPSGQRTTSFSTLVAVPRPKC